MRAQVGAYLDDAENTAALTQEKLAAAALTPLGAAEDTARSVRAKLNGQVGTELDSVNMLARKLTGKALKRAQRHLSDAYSYAYATGMVYPTIEQVVSGLQTGDYFGSMQLPDLGRIAPPGANGKGIPQVLPGVPTGPGSSPFSTPDVPGLPIGPIGPGPVLPPTLPPGTFPPPTSTPPPSFPPPSSGPGPTTPPGTTPPPSSQPPPPSSGPGPSFGPQPPGFPPGCAFTNDNWTSDPELVFTQQPFGLVARPLVPGDIPVPAGQFTCWVRLREAGNPNTPDFNWLFYLPNNYEPDSFGDGRVWGVPASGTMTQFRKCFDRCHSGAPTEGEVPGPVDQPQPPACPVDPCAPAPVGICPPDQPAAPCKPPAPEWKGKLTKDNDFDCTQWEDLVRNVGGLDFVPSNVINMATQGLKVTPIIGEIATILTGGAGAVLPSLAGRLADWLKKQITQATTIGGCNLAELVPIELAIGAMRFLEKYTGVVPPAAMETLRQAEGWVCQYKLPGGPAADEAYIADQISKEVWECWHKAEGDLIRSAEQVMQAKRTKPGVRDALHAFWRGKIDQKTYENYVRGAGVLREDERRVFEWVESATPSLSDLMRFMVRDVFDTAAVDRGKLDEDFEKKFTGKAKDYAKAIGVEEELAKFAWRAHWQRVGNTQLFDMLHRNRPGEVAEGAQMTVPQVREWLKQNDVAPALIDGLIAISYRVVTRVDARRMYRQHTIDEERLNKLYQDRGYTQERAQELVQWEQVERRIAEAKASGIPSLSTATKMYARGELTATELVQVAQQLTATSEQVDQVLTAARLARSIRRRQQVIAGVKKRYVACRLSDSQAYTQLTGVGIDADEATELVGEWRVARECRGKEVSAMYLCKLRKSRIITAADQHASLLRAGYTSNAADLMVAECTWEIEQALAAADEKARKAEQAAEEKAKRDAAKCQPKPCPSGREPIPASGANGRSGKGGR